MHFGGGNREGAPFAITEEKISDLRYQIAETFYRIKLRLNIKEKEHQELFRLMQVAIEKLNETLSGKGDYEVTLKAIDNAADYAPQVLKLEWERVKKGELPFQLARNWITPLVFILPILFVVLVWLGVLQV